MSVPTEEEFIAWRDEPVTRFIMGVCRKAASEVFDSWLGRTWQTGTADADDLLEARTRADAYLALEQTDYAGWIARWDVPEGDIPMPQSLAALERQVLLDDLAFNRDFSGFSPGLHMVCTMILMAAAFLLGAMFF